MRGPVASNVTPEQILGVAVDEFHNSKQPAAVLKHAILNSYLTPFFVKTGSRSEGNRVAIIDGYAGPGRYTEDNSEGSGAMLLRKARELGAMKLPRYLECHFVESNRQCVARLEEIAAADGGGVTHTITKAKISKELPKLLEAVKDIPLFVYLDPCGLPIPLDEVAVIFDRPAGLGEPATELLINVTAHLRRFAGMLTSDKVATLENSLKTLDAALGGDWWREAWLRECPVKTEDATVEQKVAAEWAVVTGYAERLRQRAGGLGTWIIDVKPRPDSKRAVYYLLFLTRHRDGMLVFGESASKGAEYLRRHHAEQAAEDTLFGDAADWEKAWKADEKKLNDQWANTIADRLTAELTKGQAFKIIDRVDEILGDLVGYMRTTHMRSAINMVRKAGKTNTDPKGEEDLYRLLITPA